MLAEYPKSGGTWLAFMLGECLSGVPMDFGSQSSILPAVGAHADAPRLTDVQGRLLRTHERDRSEYGKAICLVRHPADVAVSCYHWLPWLPADLSFGEFLPLFLDGKVDAYGSWSDHVSSWLLARRTSPLHVIHFEALRRRPARELATALDFLGADVEGQAVDRAVGANSLQEMRRKEAAAPSGTIDARGRSQKEGAGFVRSGQVGGSVEMFGPAEWQLLEAAVGETIRAVGYELDPKAEAEAGARPRGIV